MREIYDAKVIEVNYNEINQHGLQAVGQNIEEDNPDLRIAFYSSNQGSILFVLVPKE